MPANKKYNTGRNLTNKICMQYPSLKYRKNEDKILKKNNIFRSIK